MTCPLPLSDTFEKLGTVRGSVMTFPDPLTEPNTHAPIPTGRPSADSKLSHVPIGVVD
jgi:hypothetical protein